MSKPAAMSRTMQTAACTPTRVARNFEPRGRPLGVLPKSAVSPFSAELRSWRVAWRAGARPKTIPVTAVKSSEYPHT